MKGIAILIMILSSLGARALDLSGRVLTDDGEPIKDAAIFIYTAGPKVGTSSLCPSCYPDCRKKARSDSAGSFQLTEVNPKLIFRLLAVAGGFEAMFVPNIDPATGPAEIRMKKFTLDGSKSHLEGMIIDDEGEPVAGAVLKVEGFTSGEITKWGGFENVVQPVAVSDERGRFILESSERASEIHAVADARGLAKRWVRLKGGTDHFVRMEFGATVRGRLSRRGKPVSDAVVGLVTVSRRPGEGLHEFEDVTDAEGNFAIFNVTPNQNYFLFSRMASLGTNGALKTQFVNVGTNGSTIDLGELQLTRAYSFGGKIVLTDGEEIPTGSSLSFGREAAWDSAEMQLPLDGRFEFTGIPAESVSLYVHIKGYKLSHKNPSLDWYNHSIVGRLEKDLTDFRILLEPGKWRVNEEADEAPPGTVRQPTGLPLRSVELVP